MIDHTLLKPAAVVVLAGATAAALTVGQSAFAVGPAAARARAAPAGPGPRPVAAANPGTLGLGQQCAFSRQPAGVLLTWRPGGERVPRRGGRPGRAPGPAARRYLTRVR